MTTLLSAFFLVAGASVCLIAALGVLRLPDFFLRMHAATKAGVAGAGLVLVGVALAEPSISMAVKVALAIAFLLLTTPVAGHLLARAGYVAGVPLWGGTYQDELKGELQRGTFDAQTPRRLDHNASQKNLPGERVVVALTGGPGGEAAMEFALSISAQSGRPLTALAIVDTKMLSNVGPVPIGGNHYAAQLRRDLSEKARHALAETVQTFEEKAKKAGAAYAIAMEEGDPVKVILARGEGGSITVVSRDGWFDHGVGDGRSNPLQYLLRAGVRRLISVASLPAALRSATFVHDGSPGSDRTLDWFLDLDPWPEAALHLVPDESASQAQIGGARERAAAELGERLAGQDDHAVGPASSQALIFGSEDHSRWSDKKRLSSQRGLENLPILVFG